MIQLNTGSRSSCSHALIPTSFIIVPIFNAPPRNTISVQGTAADIIKIAMNRVYRRLKDENLKSRLVLQVHDELLIETVEAEKDAVIALLEEEMHKAADLDVELEVGTEFGYNWYDAH